MLPGLGCNAHHHGFLTTAACSGLRSAHDCRSRRALLHLLHSCAQLYGPTALVTHDPQQTYQQVLLSRHGGLLKRSTRKSRNARTFGMRWRPCGYTAERGTGSATCLLASTDLRRPSRTASTTMRSASRAMPPPAIASLKAARSEERRVGKECRSRWGAD